MLERNIAFNDNGPKQYSPDPLLGWTSMHPPKCRWLHPLMTAEGPVEYFYNSIVGSFATGDLQHEAELSTSGSAGQSQLQRQNPSDFFFLASQQVPLLLWDQGEETCHMRMRGRMAAPLTWWEWWFAVFTFWWKEDYQLCHCGCCWLFYLISGCYRIYVLRSSFRAGFAGRGEDDAIAEIASLDMGPLWIWAGLRECFVLIHLCFSPWYCHLSPEHLNAFHVK